jgi:pimeloyl-ACP methyl ester carboxylesterase
MTMTWDDWARRATMLDVGGFPIATYDLGRPDAPVVTFLHGFPSSSHDVGPVLGVLGDRVRMVTLDFLGFGASAKPVDHRYELGDCADAVEALWAAAGVTSTVLFAHDYGVSVAQELLARLAEGRGAAEIMGVAWTNGGLWPDLHRQTRGQQALRDPEHGAALAASITEEVQAAGIAVTWGRRRPMTDADLAPMWASMSRDGGVALMPKLLRYIDDRIEHQERWATALASAPVPMRFVWGDLDPVSGGHVADRIAERLPSWPTGRQLRRLADVGHWPPLEAPGEVAAALAELARA